MRGLHKFHLQCVVLLKLRSTSQFYKGTWKPVAAEFQRASISHFQMELQDPDVGLMPPDRNSLGRIDL